MSFEIEGKVALITGGVSGIGFQNAQVLLRNGLKGVTLVDINTEIAGDAIKKLENQFGPNKVIFVKADVSRLDEVREAFIRTIKKFGNIDILINSAGIIKDALWDKEVAVNILGVMNTMVLGINEYLSKNQQGPEAVILNVSSVAGLLNLYQVPIYTGTKYAVLGLTRSWGNEEVYRQMKIRVIAVCPVATNTPLMGLIEGRTLPGPLYENINLDDFVLQEPSFLAEEMLKILKKAPSGSIWVVEGGEPAFEYIYPSIESMKKNLL